MWPISKKRLYLLLYAITLGFKTAPITTCRGCLWSTTGLALCCLLSRQAVGVERANLLATTGLVSQVSCQLGVTVATLLVSELYNVLSLARPRSRILFDSLRHMFNQLTLTRITLSAESCYDDMPCLPLRLFITHIPLQRSRSCFSDFLEIADLQ